MITIEIEEELSDAAWLALLDLNLENASVRGNGSAGTLNPKIGCQLGWAVH